MKCSRRLPQAEDDIKGVAWHYAGESMSTVDVFLGEVKRATGRIERMPGIGSLRFAKELNVDGLRAYPLQNFPYLLFYIEHEDHIDLVRVLHTHRDIFDLPFGE